MNVGVSVLIPVYNQVRNLELVLTGLEMQSFKDFEVVVGDDGSGREMKEFLGGYRALPRVTHVWHPDEGFRRGKILNDAAKAALSRYLVFMDSDCIPHPHFLRDHWVSHQTNVVLCGRRVDLGERIARQLTPEDIRRGRYHRFTKEVLGDILKGQTFGWEESVRLPHPLLGRLIHWKATRILGSNFSLDRELFERVNGFNEDYVGYGFEDSDLGFRLELAGARLKSLRHMAIQFHLNHPRGETSSENVRLFADAVRRRDPLCKNGLRKL
ncbi:MAG TPA: glycosyltransferase [Bacteroidota bacterium]|jgi:glycosyltransferase involved in cell wall biosynthesis|nr:glycosyltransferase [Bacteroidota bacterium]